MKDDNQMEWPGSTRRGKRLPTDPDLNYPYFSDEPIPEDMLRHALMTVRGSISMSLLMTHKNTEDADGSDAT
jgi:hypothetical protein